MCHLGPYSDWPLNSWIAKWFIAHELRNILMAGTKAISQFKKKKPSKTWKWQTNYYPQRPSDQLESKCKLKLGSLLANLWKHYNKLNHWLFHQEYRSKKGLWLSRIDVIESVYQSLQFSSLFMVNSSHPQSVYINNWFATEFATKLS